MAHEEYIYTSIADAKIEIQKRWNNVPLKEKVSNYLGEVPSFVVQNPRAYFFRNIITPCTDYFRIIEIAEELDIEPIGLEYTEDRFSTRNEDKLTLLKLSIFEGRAKNGDAILHYEKIADVKENDNKKFSEIKTYSGENLVTFHHNLIPKNTPKKLELHDMSDWVKKNGGVAKEYYKTLFALCVCHGVLLETFVTNGAESEFEKAVVLPAFEFVENKFGVKPLIVQHVPDINDKYWWCYPTKTLDQQVSGS